MKNISKNFKLNLPIIGFILIDLYLIASSSSNVQIALLVMSLALFIRALFNSKNKAN
ncbi:hypothetical protein [Romboutsia lituseburensis]|uniref:hypothetical protein n=1 Tax=Romboutsia lituseburensis TaxID=1537 RepID=UPI00215AADAF|nr:hypothetical protein [Romboutsia lituseburensis]MCR8747190.1 hypothetical protein [Romboutsia lituseburensis]